MRRVGAALAVLALLVASCGTGTGRDEPLTLGALYPLSGSQGPGGVEEFRGVRLAVRMVNERGGVHGRTVALEPIDVPGSDAVPAAVARLDRDGIRLVLGTYGSTISEPAAVAATRRGMLFWETGAVGTMEGPHVGTLSFRVAPSGRSLGASAIRFVVGELAGRLRRHPESLRFAVVRVDDAYGNEVAEGALHELRRRGLTVAANIRYDPLRLHPAVVAERVAAARPDVIFAASYVDDGVAVRRALVRRHVHLLAGIGTSSSYCMQAFGDALGADAVGLFASDKPDAEYVRPAGLEPSARRVFEEASRRYERRYGEEMSAAALSGFASAWALLREVMPRASGLEPPAVAAAARAIDLPVGSLPNGSGLRFGPPGTAEAGSNVRAANVIWEWTRLRHREVVWPPRFATAPLRVVPLAS